MDAADRKHVNSSWGDTVKYRLDAFKSPTFRLQSPCTYIYVKESQRFWDFVRIYTYESTKGLSGTEIDISVGFFVSMAFNKKCVS